jgi:hypothetical protein
MKITPEGKPYVPPTGNPEIDEALIRAIERDCVPYARLQAALHIPDGLIGGAWWDYIEAYTLQNFGISCHELYKMTPMELCLIAETSKSPS